VHLDHGAQLTIIAGKLQRLFKQADRLPEAALMEEDLAQQAQGLGP
jgi:hypothetical protein